MRPLHVLMVEDNPQDGELIVRELHRSGFQPQWRRVETESDFLEHLEPEIQLVLSDFALPQFTGLRALELLLQTHPDIPFILISGTVGEEAAVEALKQGATDYLLKDRLGRLGPAIDQALRERALRAERKKLEEQFLQSQKMEAIGRLSGGVAHDFNNILTVIQMHSSLLQMNEQLPLNAREMARQITQASERAATLTRQLLTFSRRQEPQRRDLSLNEMVTNMAKMLQRILGEDIQMDLHYSAEPLWIHADAGMMDQILLNLAVNSRDAMPAGGRLLIETLAVEVKEDRLVKQAQEREGKYACLRVSDTGCGIPEENLPRIFEPFFTTKDVGQGTGLGLATVYGIVQQHQGWIDVESSPEKATTFHIYFPQIQIGQDPNISPKTAGLSPHGSERLLVVEDDPVLRLLVPEVLARLGYCVQVAADGRKALQLWDEAEEPFQLLLTDLVLPNAMSGKELAEELLRRNPQLKILYTSGYSREFAGKELVLREGINFIAKPYYPNSLAVAIRSCLEEG